MPFYKLYLLDEQLRFYGTRGIVALDDETACGMARILSNGKKWELWRDDEMIKAYSIVPTKGSP